jgi:16S rRNA (guanine527-N7)-methyltransferase
MGPMVRDAVLLNVRNAQDFAAAFDVSRETLERLEAYERLLRQWQKAVNLVAPSTLDHIWQRHFADSAQILPLAPTGARAWLDLGSGAGFPGLVVGILIADPASAGRMGVVPSPSLVVPSPLAGGDNSARITPTPNPFPQGGGGPVAQDDAGRPHVTLIESNTRKAAFLREVVRQTGIADRIGVDILSTRIESAATQVTVRPDVVSARALAPLDQLIGLAAPLFAPHTVGVFMKGREAASELETARKSWNLNVELVPSRTEPQGHIVLVRQPTPKLENEGKNP